MFRYLVAFGVCVWLTGCGRPTPAAPSGAGERAVSAEGRAQPKLPTIPLWIGTKEMVAEVARTEPQIRMGMMFRTNLAENEGMLFVFPGPSQRSFWMKNVTVPLSCAYIDPEGIIREIHDLRPGVEEPVFSVSERIQFVLETPQGWFGRNQVSTGALVRTELGSLSDTLLRRR